MMAVRNALPFEFLPRWPDLRRYFGKVSDEAVDFLDQRDRDLEDYLADLADQPAGGGTQVALRAFWDSQFSDGTTSLSAVSEYKMPDWATPTGTPYYAIGGASVSGNEITPGTTGLYSVHVRFQLAVMATAGPISVDDWAYIDLGIDDRGTTNYDSYRAVELMASTAGRNNAVVVEDFIVIEDAADVIRASVQWVSRGTTNVASIACYGAVVTLNRIGDVP